MDLFEWLLQDICGGDLFSAIIEVFDDNLLSSGGPMGPAYDAVVTTYNKVIAPFAVMLVFIYFMIAVVEKLSSEDFSWEQLWKQMAMLLVSKILIEHGLEILQMLFGLGASLVDGFVYAAPEVEPDRKRLLLLCLAFKEGLGLTGILSALGDLLLFIIIWVPWLLSWLMRLCVYIVCYSRMIELYVRVAFAPIALSDFFHSGIHSNGWRYLKDFFALCLQGFLILVIAVVYAKLFSGLISGMENIVDLITYLGRFVAYYASAIMLLFKTRGIAKEIVGVN